MTVSSSSETNMIPASLREKMVDTDLVPLWESPTAHKLDVQREQAHIWPWSATRSILTETAQISSPKVVERRVLSMVNPFSKTPEDEATTGTISATLQTLLAGEVARPHRHSMNALRFVMEGHGASTIVDGKDCPMEPGDLVLTPAWTWHSHHHNGQGATIWMDVLDVDLQLYLGTDEFQPGPIVDQTPEVADSSFAVAGIVPDLDATERPYSPVFRYEWKDAVTALNAAPIGEDGSRRVRYVNPLNGQAVMATLDCYLTGLIAGLETREFRTTANTVCCVVAGQGISQIGDRQIKWGEKDIFTIPQNTWVTHTSVEGAQIFMVTDREIYRKLGLLKESFKD
ncbi:cupin domain-containing protein [Paraburkholderia tuberum]|uniref:Gentisate 1,2-dioxygenase n=1 Tax=Paraburkholderia tuberum TaxID=157910 RepID=A0A1H1KGR8_9BURK|nr:cupin domain-containing protein [Paraburkholderia tuberum]SDR61538.1 gentisate 1,2-dioxygenase [Paraburkholderia tuberum]